MEREPDVRDDRPAAADDGTPGRVRPRRRTVAAMVALGVVALVLVLGLGFDLATSSPKLCASCHEMELRADSWAQSAHATVTCVKCHQEPTAWYDLPGRVSARAQLLRRDLKAHATLPAGTSIDESTGDDMPVSDEVCLQCHDPNRKATSGFRILIDHPEHAKRNGSCVSCHVRTAHPVEGRGTALSLMAQCYTCHGTTTTPAASAECGVCHPAEFELTPASHTEQSWARGHGDISLADTGQCRMCHVETFCSDCHGVEMPHPDDWAGGPGGHAEVASSNPESCDNCHGTYPDLCTMCHHTSFDPARGDWIEQHDVEVRSEGTAYCMTCHPGPYCSFCHTRLVEGDDR